jgi:tetratricopeptide (TPR) repeat protein
MEDDLHEARDHFYAYNFAKALQILDSIAGDDLVEVEKDALKARAYLGLGEVQKTKQLQSSGDNPAVKASAYTHVYLKSSNENKAKGRERLMELLSQKKDPTVVFFAACVLAQEEQYVDAYDLLKDSSSPDLCALKAQILVLMNRADLAEQEIRKAPDGGDSAASKMVASATQMASGNFQEAFLTYMDLQSQYWGDADASALLNGRAAANIHRGNYQEAQEDIQRALVLEPMSDLSLTNAACVSVHMQQAEEADKFLALLCEKHPAHPVSVKSRELKEAMERFKNSS